MTNPLNIIFPMAGDGMRFGGNFFKPFLDCTEKLFIEVAIDSFDSLKGRDLRFHFIFREDQETAFNVSARLRTLFPSLHLTFHIIPNKTSGPLETIREAMRLNSLTGSFFVCDCDHYVNMEPMIASLADEQVQVMIPVTPFPETHYANWGKVKLDLLGNILSFYEKEYVPFSADYSVKGLLGCYFFRNIQMLTQYPVFGNFSDIFPLLEKQTTRIVHIQEHGSFGTPEDLTAYRFQLARKRTYFVDLDGTLFLLPKHVSYDINDIHLLPGTLEKLREWKAAGHKIVLTTGRISERREKLEFMLAHLKIPYDELITSCHPGPRILINDKKPYCPFHRMAVGVQLKRNEGISKVNVPETPEIIRVLKGGSFATVFLIRKNDSLQVRKYIEKTPANSIHYETLRRQLDELRRFDFYSQNLVPKIYSVFESEDEFYFDMEYLEGYEELSSYPYSTVTSVLPVVIDRLHKDIYCYSKQIDGVSWLKQFLTEKIFSKVSMLESLGPVFETLLKSNELTVNGKTVSGLLPFLEALSFADYAPNSVSPIHGDLTLENILYNAETGEFRIIDQSGARYSEPKEFDGAKILQSLLTHYETWDTQPSLFVADGLTITIPNDFLNVNRAPYAFFIEHFDTEDSAFFKRSVFFLATYYVRMIPFLLKKSESHALCGLSLALYLFQASKDMERV